MGEDLMLKPQDVLVLLRLAGETRPWSFQQLSQELGMSVSEVHAALKRAEESKLYNAKKRQVQRESLLEFAVHGIPYVYPAKRLARAYGVPTAYSAEPLRKMVVTDHDDLLVWPHPDGEQFGDAVEPLYPSAPEAARRNGSLHRRLALVDALRIGRVRERKMAKEALDREFDKECNA
jgi:DNA-binding Lrp family transcriptional regulator